MKLNEFIRGRFKFKLKQKQKHLHFISSFVLEKKNINMPPQWRKM